MELALEQIGLTQEEVQDRVVERFVEQLSNSSFTDEDGDEVQGASSLWRKLMAAARQMIDEKVNQIAEEQLKPKIDASIESFVLQETNKWGEKKGKEFTFTEYLVARAEQYLTEPVDYNGKPKMGGDYNWKEKSTRLVHLVESHLQYRIEVAMKQALAQADETIRNGLKGALDMALDKIKAKASVAFKR